jgi:hypothetical protein
MNALIRIATLSIVLSLAASPAFAQHFSIIKPNSQGGYSGIRGTSATGPNGGSMQKGVVFKTDGQGTVQYGTGRSIVTPSGSTYSGTSSGTYNRTTGLSSSGSHTINGDTYYSSVDQGTITVTDSEGNSKTFTRPFRH